MGFIKGIEKPYGHFIAIEADADTLRMATDLFWNYDNLDENKRYVRFKDLKRRLQKGCSIQLNTLSDWNIGCKIIGTEGMIMFYLTNERPVMFRTGHPLFNTIWELADGCTCNSCDWKNCSTCKKVYRDIKGYPRDWDELEL